MHLLKSFLRHKAALVLAVAAAAGTVAGGCGSGGGGSSGPNRGSQCTQVLQAVCSRLGSAMCAVFPSNQIQDCVSAGVSTCCNGDCNASVISTQADIDTCVTAINADTCAQLDVTNGGTLPSTCLGVVRSALTSASSALSASASSSPGARLGGMVSR